MLKESNMWGQIYQTCPLKPLLNMPTAPHLRHRGTCSKNIIRIINEERQPAALSRGGYRYTLNCVNDDTAA